MKKLLLVLLLLFVPSSAWAQCSGAFPNNTVCGNITGATNTPRSTSLSAIVTSTYGIKTPADLATTTNITLSGEQTIDGVLTSASRVLVKNQSTASQNGIYTTSAGAWARAADFSAAGQVVQGTLIHVNQGTVNSNTNYVVSSSNPITPGLTSINFQIGAASLTSAPYTTGDVLCFANAAGSIESCGGGTFTGFANPTVQIGLSVINGSATTAMRSDAAPALSQTIVPTWTGLHTFNAGLNNLANEKISGYLRVGSQTAPTNTTAGDLTATRLSLGNADVASVGGALRAAGTMSATDSWFAYIEPSIQSSVTGSAGTFLSIPSTQAAAFTLPLLRHYSAIQGTFGAGSTVTDQRGFYAAGNLTGATNNYGFYGEITAATGRWNFYAAGTAGNYLAGGLQIGGVAADVGVGQFLVTSISAPASAKVKTTNSNSPEIMLFDTTDGGWTFFSQGGTLHIATVNNSGFWTGNVLDLPATGSAALSRALTVNSATGATTGKLTVYGSEVINTARPTYSGDLVLYGNSGAANTVDQNGGLEFVAAASGSGYGWRLINPDLTSGNLPLVFQSRSNSAAWTEVARLTFLSTLDTFTITSPANLTSGELAGLKISMTSGINQGIKVQQALTGTITGGYIPVMNRFYIASDDVNNGANFLTGFIVEHYFGGSAMRGGREAFAAYAYLTASSTTSNTNKNYVAVTGVATAQSGDGGTGTTAANSRGALFGGGFVGVAVNGATNLNNVTGAEFNTAMQTGSSVAFKSIVQLSARNDDAVSGSVVDAILWIYSQTGGAKFADGILLQQDANGHDWPINSTGTLFRTAGTGSAKDGINIASVTFSGAPIIVPLMTPSSSTATCTTGSAKWDASFIYICTATNNWKRVALSTF